MCVLIEMLEEESFLKWKIQTKMEKMRFNLEKDRVPSIWGQCSYKNLNSLRSLGG